MSNPIKANFAWLCFSFVCALFACTSKNDPILDKKVTRELRLADSLLIVGKEEEANQVFNQVRSETGNNTPSAGRYYIMQAGHNYFNPEKMDAYADSALAIFTKEEYKKEFESQLVQALLLKGDACLKSKKYNDALYYYYKGKVLLERKNNACGSSEFSSKMAALFYDQKKFLTAAKYWTESIRMIDKCGNGLPAQRLFYLKQGYLNNTGVAYENANMPDSALVYYLKDLDYIYKTAKENKEVKFGVDWALLVSYDNLGGIYLQKGQISKARDFLLKSIAIDTIRKDGSTIAPLIKLADLYMRTGEFEKSDAAFVESKNLLDQYFKSNKNSGVKWNKLRSEFFFKTNQPAKAYQVLRDYIRISDSIETSGANLYNVDVAKEFTSLQQQSDLNNLEKKDQLKQYYLAAAITFLVLLVIIVFLITRNLRHIKKSSESTRQNNEELQRTLSELEQANQNYIRIMRVMAHDLKNPLSGITGLVAIMLDDADFPEEHKSMLKLIESSGVHSLEMINELLKSGLADEREELVKEDVNLQVLLGDSVELLQFKASEKKQQIVFETKEAIWTRVSKEKIWRVFNNLLVNAIKFSPTGSYIHVDIRREGQSILVSIADNGVGIPEKDKNQVFEMFTPVKKPGTNGEQPFGLGLSISKRIVEKHGGKIWFEDNIGGGTIFYLFLPS